MESDFQQAPQGKGADVSAQQVSAGRHYIGGEFVAAADGQTAPVLEKATGAEMGRYAVGSAADVERAVAAAVRAQPAWAAALPDERAWVLRKAADILDRRADEMVDILMRETGSVRGKAQGEVAAARRKFHESAALPGRGAGDILPTFRPGKLTLLQRIPLGVVAVITPWNFPVVLGLRPLGPALALGNAVVLKPAELTPIGGGQLLAEILHEAGVPAGVFNVVTGEGPGAGQPLAEHPDVAMIHFTGSTEIGRLMARIAADGFKRTSLELGGDNAFVVLDDADVEAASACGAWASFDFQGQTCISASRHIVHRAVADRYRDAIVERARRIRVGDPYRQDVELGPLISEVQRDRVHKEIVEASVAMGARIVEGGTYDGLFYRPTVLEHVTPDMPAFTEEIFGPVVPITVVDSEAAALELTNAAQALVSAVYTADVDRGLAFAERVRCGLVHVNDAMGRPTGEDDLGEFTQRRFIGVQRAPLTYPY
jgi:benzaldehyde dehydrogenase (NAD)